MESFEHLDPYQLLGISPNADAATIKQAYLRQIAQYHPDRFAQASAADKQYAAQRAQRITVAYHQLSNPSRPVPGPTRPAEPFGAEASTPRDRQALLYAQASSLLAQGRAAEALPLLQTLHKLDPNYRDVAALLASAEAASVAPATNRRRKGVLWVGGGLLVGGALAALGWQLRPKSLSPVAGIDQTPTIPSGSVVPSPSPVIVVGVDPTPLSTPQLVASPPALPTSVEQPTQAPSPTSPPTLTPSLEPTVAPSLTPSLEPTVAPSFTPTLEPTVVPSATTAPTQAPPPVVAISPGSVESGPVISSTNFGGPVGWPTFSTPNYSLGQEGGGYVITAAPNIGAIFGHGGPLPQGNVVVAADVTVQSGLGGLWFGPGKGYRFVIEPGGTYRIEVGTASGPVILVGATPSRAVWAGTNRLQVAVQGRAASFYANGVLLRQITLGTGMAGIPAGLVVIPTNVAARSRFDNFVVRGLPGR